MKHSLHAIVNSFLLLQLREQYLKNEPMHDRKETYAAITKSIKSLNDPFTRLLEPTRYSALKRGNQGSVTGVGLEVGFGDGTDSQLVVCMFMPCDNEQPHPCSAPTCLHLCCIYKGSAHLQRVPQDMLSNLGNLL